MENPKSLTQYKSYVLSIFPSAWAQQSYGGCVGIASSRTVWSWRICFPEAYPTAFVSRPSRRTELGAWKAVYLVMKKLEGEGNG
jgi:hypothetical protein